LKLPETYHRAGSRREYRIVQGCVASVRVPASPVVACGAASPTGRRDRDDRGLRHPDRRNCQEDIRKAKRMDGRLVRQHHVRGQAVHGRRSRGRSRRGVDHDRHRRPGFSRDIFKVGKDHNVPHRLHRLLPSSASSRRAQGARTRIVVEAKERRSPGDRQAAAGNCFPEVRKVVKKVP